MSIACEPWPLAPHCLPDGWVMDPAQWSDRQRFAVEAAYGLLRLKTAGAYGLCTVTVRPCGEPPKCEPIDPGVMGVGWMRPTLVSGQPVNHMCGCRNSCSCGPECRQILDPFAAEIVEVRIDGIVVPQQNYEVQDYRYLVRLDGGCWPTCQQMGRRAGEPGTWTVTYKTGWLPDGAGRVALTRLAVEVDKACCPSPGQTCVLSDWVVEVVRDGVRYDLAPHEGSTGLPVVDRWIEAVNPHGARSQFRAFSVDTVRGRRTTWSPPAAPEPAGPTLMLHQYGGTMVGAIADPLSGEQVKNPEQ